MRSGSPYAEHPFRWHRLPGLVLKGLIAATVLIVYHHFTYAGSLSDAQWAALSVDGVKLETSQRTLNSGDYQVRGPAWTRKTEGGPVYVHFDKKNLVKYVSGRELILQDEALLGVGDEITRGREILGRPKIVQNGGTTYYYYHRGHLSVACSLGIHERIRQISLQRP